MWPRLFILFFITSFLTSIVMECLYSIDLTEQISVASSIMNNDFADHCQSTDCKDEMGHCLHHCAGTHNLYYDDSMTQIRPITGFIVDQNWHYIFHYEGPFLDPSLRPPLVGASFLS